MKDPASRPWRLYFLLILVMLIWALNLIATKLALREIPVALAVLLLAFAMGPEAIQARKIGGSLLALNGVRTLHLRATSSGHGPSTAGYLMIIASALTFACYFVFGKGIGYVLGKLPASRDSYFNYLQPVTETSLGVTILGELVSTALVGGGALILGGVFLTERI